MLRTRSLERRASLIISLASQTLSGEERVWSNCVVQLIMAFRRGIV